MTGADPGAALAWRVPPDAYLAARDAAFRVPDQPISVYVTMRDGCRLALDVWLPEGQLVEGQASAETPLRFPAIVIATPYYRRFALRKGAAAGVESSPNTWRYRETFVPRGYALVVLDVRGSGASFGTRDGFRSPVERDDYREVLDWLVAQPWSDGSVGATGISYLGAAATFLASTGHPAVKAIAPISAVWDTYADHYYPGGILLNRLAESYDDLMVALDHDRRDLLDRFAYFGNPAFEGPQPVDNDEDRSLLRAAIREHGANFRMPDFITEFRFTDDRLPYDPQFGAPSFSPYNYADTIGANVAVYSVSGWMDGGGFANGAISRFLSLPNPGHLLLGPWDHGARTNVSPWRDSVEPKFPILTEVLRFFDHYLMGRDTGLDRESSVHYFSVHDENWHEAPHWPPSASARTLYLGPERSLAPCSPDAAVDAFKADFTFATGDLTRYERLAAFDVKEYYADWHERQRDALSYTSEPLERAVEITGHPVVTLHVESSEADAALFVYLSEVEADGRVRYVTEGMLRALHRREAERGRFQQGPWPFRPFARTNASPLAVGQSELLRFALLPTSWTFEQGSRIRLTITGADRDHFAQVPHGRPPLLRIALGGDRASAIELPWRDA